MNPSPTSKEALREKRAALEVAFRKKKQSEQRALGLVEYMVENSAVDPNWLATNGKFLNTSYYQDAVEERAIIKQCGFAVCPNQIKKVWKQQYCIDLRSKKVYDITERKNFCSDICFSASNQFKNQLLTSPLWMRSKEKIPPFEVNLTLKKGLRGDDIPLIASIVPDEKDNLEDIVEVVAEKTAAKPKMLHKPALEPVVNPYKFVLKIMQQWLTDQSSKWLQRIDASSFEGDVQCIEKQLLQIEINKPNVNLDVIKDPSEQFGLAADHSDRKRKDQTSLTQVRAFLAGRLEYTIETADDVGKMFKDRTSDVIEKTEETVSIVLPLANVSAQKNLRKKIVMNYIEKWFPQLATITGLEFRQYQRDLTELVSTFNLTADTITFRPHEVPLLCFVVTFLLSVRDPAIKERLTTEPVKADLSKFLAAYERTIEEFEEDVLGLGRTLESRRSSD